MNGRLLGWVAMASVGAMAGCSDGSDDGPDRLFDGRVDFQTLADEYDRQFEASADTFTDPATLPESGSARYEGVLGLASSEAADVPLDVGGQLTLDVDFDASDPLSGSVDRFVEADGGDVSGTLVVGDSAIYREADVEDEYTFEFDLDGTLVDADGREVEVDAVGLGDFLGDDRGHVIGAVEGEVSSGGEDSDVEGDFIGER